MNPFLLASIGLVAPIAVATLAGFRARTGDQLVAFEFAAAITTITLMLLSVAFDQSSLVDLALTLALLAFPGTLVLTHFLERWL